VALASSQQAFVASPEATITLAPLRDVRGIAVSPDGEWVVTGSHGKDGFQVWRLGDGERVANRDIDGLVYPLFSPDGKSLMTREPPCRLWEVGTWLESRRIGGLGLCFTADGRLLAVQDADRVIRMVEAETGRTIARFESPDLCSVEYAGFSPDGSRLVISTNDGPALHVWNLRSIRHRLAGMGLDWDAPPLGADDPARPSAPLLATAEVDYGPLTETVHVDAVHRTEPPAGLVERYSAVLAKDPDDADAHHHRGHALTNLRRYKEALDDLSRAIALRPRDAHLRRSRARLLGYLHQNEPAAADLEIAVSDLEIAMAIEPGRDDLREELVEACNHLAWVLATGSGPRRELDRALAVAGRATSLRPDNANLLNTLGVVQYRLGRHAESIATLERSLAAGRGQADAFDLFFLAMAHHRLGHRDEARRCLDRGVRWMSQDRGLGSQQAKELASFRLEAERVLSGADWPDDVFANPRE
jgi:Tfp pilus assembly protein PilF